MRTWSYLTTRGNSLFRVGFFGTVARPLRSFSRAVLLVGLVCQASLGCPHDAQGRGLVRRQAGQSLTISPPNPKPLVGERLSFHGQWFGIPVGTGWIEVKEVVSLEGHQAYHIEAEGHSNDFLATFYPVHDVIHSYLSVETLQPLRFEKFQREGHYHAEEVVTFDYQRMVATCRSLLNQSVKETSLPPDVQDLISFFYWLRTHPFPTPPSSVGLSVYVDEKIYKLNVNLLESLWFELLHRGTFPCLLAEPVAAFKGILVRRGRVWVYVTSDERRIPLFIKIETPWGPITGVIDAESLGPIGAPASPVVVDTPALTR